MFSTRFGYSFEYPWIVVSPLPHRDRDQERKRRGRAQNPQAGRLHAPFLLGMENNQQRRTSEVDEGGARLLEELVSEEMKQRTAAGGASAGNGSRRSLSRERQTEELEELDQGTARGGCIRRSWST